jgi:hypothetical protein
MAFTALYKSQGGTGGITAYAIAALLLTGIVLFVSRRRAVRD